MSRTRTRAKHRKALFGPLGPTPKGPVLLIIQDGQVSRQPIGPSWTPEQAAELVRRAWGTRAGELRIIFEGQEL